MKSEEIELRKPLLTRYVSIGCRSCFISKNVTGLAGMVKAFVDEMRQTVGDYSVQAMDVGYFEEAFK